MDPETLPLSGSPLPKLLLGDDHQIILDALGAMMKTEFDVLAVDNSQAFIAAVEDFHPDVAILDVSMPGGDGFVTARKVLERQPDLPIVFLSMYSEPSYLDQAVQVGAKAYLSKRLPAQDLLYAIRTVLDGGTLAESIEGRVQQGSAQQERPNRPATRSPAFDSARLQREGHCQSVEHLRSHG